jgi:hypothetical protein
MGELAREMKGARNMPALAVETIKNGNRLSGG